MSELTLRDLKESGRNSSHTQDELDRTERMIGEAKALCLSTASPTSVPDILKKLEEKAARIRRTLKKKAKGK